MSAASICFDRSRSRSRIGGTDLLLHVAPGWRPPGGTVVASPVMLADVRMATPTRFGEADAVRGICSGVA